MLNHSYKNSTQGFISTSLTHSALYSHPKEHTEYLLNTPSIGGFIHASQSAAQKERERAQLLPDSLCLGKKHSTKLGRFVSYRKRRPHQKWYNLCGKHNL